MKKIKDPKRFLEEVKKFYKHIEIYQDDKNPDIYLIVNPDDFIFHTHIPRRDTKVKNKTEL